MALSLGTAMPASRGHSSERACAVRPPTNVIAPTIRSTCR